jgi:tetratricopeptide (TPR) repeat protein
MTASYNAHKEDDMGFLDKLVGKDPETLYAQARQLVDQGQYDKATRKLETARDLAPDLPAIWFLLGFCYSHQVSGKESESVLLAATKKCADAYQESVELAEARGGLDNSQIAKACFAVGLYCQQQKDYDKSVQYLEKAVQGNPQDNETKLFLSTSYLFQGRVENAESLALQALEADPTNGKFLAHWKELRKRLGKEAIADLPEEQRRKVYADFVETKDSELLLGTNLVGDFQRIAAGNPLGALAQMQQSLQQSGEKARRAATEKMLRKYGLRQFELLLIEEEGKEKRWPFQAVRG